MTECLVLKGKEGQLARRSASGVSCAPTRAKGAPEWYLSDPSLVSGGSRNDYTPLFEIGKAGTLTLHVGIDGVRSDDVVVWFF